MVSRPVPRGPLMACVIRLAVVVVPILTASTLAPSVAGAQCIDEAIRDELNARRRYRGVRERLFQKALRH